MTARSKQRAEPASAPFPSTGLIRLSRRDGAEYLPRWPRSAIRLWVALGLSFWLGAAWAQELAPDAQMKQFTSEVIAAIKQDKDGQSNHPAGAENH